MSRLFSLVFVAGIVLCAVGAQASGKVPVCVSILPQQYFLERIGGDLVEVSVLVMPGASPATYEPTPRQMARLARAKGYFAIGVPFEGAWLPRIGGANRRMAIIKTDRNVSKITMDEHHHDEHHHDEHGHDDHEEESSVGILDPHIWLSPDRVKVVARNTYLGLVQIDPSNKATYEANLLEFIAEIDRLDQQVRRVLEQVPEEKRTFMVFHPSWGYFADQYGLRQVAIESEGKAPGPRELAEVVEHGRELGVTAVFYQPQFSGRSAKVIASEIGAQAVQLDPLAKDWSANLLQAAEAFRNVLR